MRPNWTIRAQLFALVLVAITPLLALVVFNTLEAHNRAREEALGDALALARIISARVDDHIRNIDGLLLAVDVLVGADLAAVDANDVKLKALQATLPDYFDRVSVLALDGRMLSSSAVSREERKELNFADRGYFKEAVAKRGLVAGETVISRTTGKWIMILARPLLAADGSVRGVVSMSTELGRFQDLLTPARLPSGSVMTLLDEQGIVLARSLEPQKCIGVNLSQSPNFRRARVEREFSAETVASDGVTRLAAYTTTGRAPWIVYVGVPSDIALASARKELMRLSALALFVVIFTMTLAFLLARRISRPIEAIASSAQQIAAGRLEVRIDPAGPAEIKNVAIRFNHMLDEMAKAQKNLRESDTRLRNIIDGLGPQMFVGLMTPEGVVLEANQPALAAAGLKREDVLGKPVEQTYWFAYSESVQRQLRAAVETAVAGMPCRFDVQVRASETQRIWLDFSMHPLRDPTGRVAYLVPSAMVITERKKAEEQLTQQLAELRRWFDATLEREERMMELKREINELLARLGQPPRYSGAAESGAGNPEPGKASAP